MFDTLYRVVSGTSRDYFQDKADAIVFAQMMALEQPVVHELKAIVVHVSLPPRARGAEPVLKPILDQIEAHSAQLQQVYARLVRLLRTDENAQIELDSPV